MPRRKTRRKKKEAPPAVEEETTSTINNNTNDKEIESLKVKLESIKDRPEIIGFIIRNSRSATIDAKDPTKIIDYAILSSSTIEIADGLAKAFQLGETEKIVLEGENAKLLSLSIGENSISVFMEKDADIKRIYKDLI